MHFNRTQFAAKTQIRLFALAVLILVFLLSSCSVDDIDLSDLGHTFDNMFSSEFKGFGVYSLPGGNSPTLRMDSILYDSTSIYKVCSSIHFDSVIVLTGFAFNYWETNGQSESNRLTQVVVDTVDLKVNGPYVHKVKITKVKQKTEYRICAVASYLVGRDTTLMFSPCTDFRTP